MYSSLVESKIRVVYRTVFVVCAMLVMFSVRWQVIEAGRFAREAADRFSDSVIPSLRGTIYAADSSTLVYSEPRYNMYLWVPELEFRELKKLQTRSQFVVTLAPFIDSTAERLGDQIDTLNAGGAKWMKVAKDLTVQTRSGIITAMGTMQGYFFSLTSKRIYPEGALAAQVLGLTNISEDGSSQGLGGIEGAWDGNLEPLSGFVSGEHDAIGNAIGTASQLTVEAKRGNSVYTTLDKRIQAIVEERLAWAVEEYGAKSGTVIILDPKTGAIIALANAPSYDPNTREVDNPEVFGNKAVTEPYEIGSVGKIFTLATALENAVVTPDSVVIQGHNGCEEIHKDLEPVCTHDHLPQPPMPIKEAFAISDNLYFYHLGEQIYNSDHQVFYKFLDKLGIGKPTGVDIAGESYGYLKDWQAWNVADIAAYSYGHSYQVNVVQAASGVATVANFGVRMQPHIVSKVVEADGTEIDFQPTALANVFSRNTVLQMDEMMHVIYQRNIFWWEHQYDDLRNFKIAMKSGTALIPFRDRPGYSNAINATYVGYDASPGRTFVMLTRLEDPAFGNLASQNSRVLWLEIFQRIKDHLGVPRIGEF